MTYYGYYDSGTTALPLRYERVELSHDDSTKCIIRLFDGRDSGKITNDGSPIEDTLVVDRIVLDHVKDLIIEAKVWEFKKHYKPRYEVMDGESWGFSAKLEVSAEQLAKATPKDRARMRRYEGRMLSSSVSNAGRRTFVGNAYMMVQDPNLIGKMSGPTDGSRAFARYRNIEDETLRSVIEKME